MGSEMSTMHNAEVVRRAYQAFNDADMKTLTESFDEHASWNTPGRSPAAGNRKGRDAVFAQFGRYGGETGGTFKAELRYVAADPCTLSTSGGVGGRGQWGPLLTRFPDAL